VTAERLQRALARAGFGSRRSAEELIVHGHVTVNGTVATIGDKVDVTTDVVTVRGATVNLDPRVQYFALHKPRGVVTTMHDPQGRPDIRSLLPSDGPRVFPVGRLDLDSEGLLFAMNDGDLANALTHPRYEIEKEYLVEVSGAPAGMHLGALRAGVDLEDGPARARAVRVVDTRPGRAQLSIVMTEGRKREVRRMLEALDLPVTRLLRVRIGPVRLGGLAPGAHRELTPDELLDLGRLVVRAERRLRHQAGDAL
jgi:23S rRNA pseudouridine2605 synthase